jgi:hypothetical protein
MFDDLKSNGIPALFLWGIPLYYPRFGFVPVLPRYKTKIRVFKDGATRTIIGGFRTVKAGDAERLQRLYAQNEAAGWLHPRRDVGWWKKRFLELDIDNGFLKEVPFPKKENFKVWENSSGEVAGYLNLEYVLEKKEIYVTEGTAIDLTTARLMLVQVLDEIGPEVTLLIRGTPDHYLNSAAYTGGGTHINPAPLAGMVKVLDWDLFFNRLKPVLEERVKKSGHALGFGLKFDNGDDHLILNCSDGLEIQRSAPEFRLDFNQSLTRLVMGLYNNDDLQYLSGTGKTILSELFPGKYPFIWDANYLY